MQVKRYVEPYGVFGAMVGDVDQPRAQFVVQLTGAGAQLDKGGQRATYYDGEECTVSAVDGYNVTSLQIEGGSTITELPYTFIVTRNTRITVTAQPATSATVAQQHSIDMGQGAVPLANASLSLVETASGAYAVRGTIDLQDVATVQKLTYDPNTCRNFFIAAITLDMPDGVTFDVNTMPSLVTGTMPSGMPDVNKTLKNSDLIEDNTYTWLFNGKTNVITVKYTASDGLERTVTITNEATLTSQTQEFTGIVIQANVEGQEGDLYVGTVNVPCNLGWPFHGEWTITPGENCTEGIMTSIFGNGSQAQVKLKGPSNATMRATLSYTGTSNYQGEQPIVPSFATMTWVEIDQVCQSGQAASTFAVGDEKTIQLSTGEDVTLVILGFDHDDLSDGSGKAAMTVGMKELLATEYRMNATRTNVGSWNNCEMRTLRMPALLAQLPSDLQDVIKQVKKKTTAGNTSTSITTSTDKLWLLAKVEVDGTTDLGYVNEGKQYEYWKTVKDGTVDDDRIKRSSNGNGSVQDWWLRSPRTTTDDCYEEFNKSGGDSASVADIFPSGVSYAFCI